MDIKLCVNGRYNIKLLRLELHCRSNKINKNNILMAYIIHTTSLK